MNKNTLNKKIRLLAVGGHNELITFFKKQIVNNELTYGEKLELFTIGAMYASSEGCFNNLKFIINQMPEILLEKEQGILRMTVDIKSFENFKEIIDFLIKEHKDKINFNVRENSWIKECIKNESLEKIEYVQDKTNMLEINDNVIKTLVRNKNIELFDYFIFNLDIKINESLESWLIENEHHKELEIIKKRNLFNSLDKDLVIKKSVKTRKI